MQAKKGGVGKAPPFCPMFFRCFQEGEKWVSRPGRVFCRIPVVLLPTGGAERTSPFLPRKEKRREQENEGIPALPIVRSPLHRGEAVAGWKASPHARSHLPQKRGPLPVGRPPLCLIGGTPGRMACVRGDLLFFLPPRPAGPCLHGVSSVGEGPRYRQSGNKAVRSRPLRALRRKRRTGEKGPGRRR